MSNNYSEYGKAVFDMIAEERPLQAKMSKFTYILHSLKP